MAFNRRLEPVQALAGGVRPALVLLPGVRLESVRALSLFLLFSPRLLRADARRRRAAAPGFRASPLPCAGGAVQAPGGCRRGRAGGADGERVQPSPRWLSTSAMLLLRLASRLHQLDMLSLSLSLASFAGYRGLCCTLRTRLIIGSNHLISQTGCSRCNIYPSAIFVTISFLISELVFDRSRLDLLLGSARGCPGSTCTSLGGWRGVINTRSPSGAFRVFFAVFFTGLKISVWEPSEDDLAAHASGLCGSKV